MAETAIPMATATSAAAETQRNGPAMAAMTAVSAAPPTTASSAYSPSALATPSAAPAPTLDEVRAVSVTRYVATAPTGMAMPNPASSPATSDSVTAAHAPRSPGAWSAAASRRSGRPQRSVGNGARSSRDRDRTPATGQPHRPRFARSENGGPGWDTGPVTTPATPNVLAQRYASPDMVAIWSAENKIIAERRLWLAVLRAQRDLGLEVPDGAFAAYEAVIGDVNLGLIAARERVTRHDVKARIEEFNTLAGYEQIHKGMTSRDLTENIEQVQIADSLRLVRDRTVDVLAALGRRAAEFADLVMAGRSHNVPAQATTLGKRFASAADEVLQAYHRISDLLDRYPLRGIKGPVGTSQDMLDLLGSTEAVAHLETAVAQEVSGSSRLLTSVGQVYPRSLDYEVVSALVQLAAGPASLATTIRLMAGAELATEGFQPGQVGSSAMPHKMNARSCERELERYLPFLGSTKVLMGAIRAGVGRETAHEVIKEHAVAVALAMREKGQSENDLIDRLAADERLPLDRATLDGLLSDRLAFTGLAGAQVEAVLAQIAAVTGAHPEAASYRPGAIL